MKFSVLVPCFDLAPWIRACLDSVRAQACGDWECVVVDDGSTDGSAAILAQYAAADGRFRILRQEHAGVGAARNVALAAAQGEWILFLDGDDVLAPDALARVSAAVASHPGAKAVRFGYARFEGTWTVGGAAGTPHPALVDVSRQVPMDALRSYLWQFAFRREAVEGLRFARYRRGEDRLFVVEAILRRLDGYVELDETLYGYRRRTGSAMRTLADHQTLLDELDHRLEVVRLVAASEKKVDFGDPEWTEWIEDFYLNHWRQLRTMKSEWVARLRELKDLPGFSRWGRLRMRIAVRWPQTLRLVSQLGRCRG